MVSSITFCLETTQATRVAAFIRNAVNAHQIPQIIIWELQKFKDIRKCILGCDEGECGLPSKHAWCGHQREVGTISSISPDDHNLTIQWHFRLGQSWVSWEKERKRKKKKKTLNMHAKKKAFRSRIAIPRPPILQITLIPWIGSTMILTEFHTHWQQSPFLKTSTLLDPSKSFLGPRTP